MYTISIDFSTNIVYIERHIIDLIYYVDDIIQYCEAILQRNIYEMVVFSKYCICI